MKINRRRFLAASTAAVALLPRRSRGQVPDGDTIPQGWQTFPIGDGGYLTGIDVADAGLAAGATTRTDVAGAYVWNGTQWDQVCNVSSLNATVGPIDNGVWEIRGAPSDFNYLYMFYGDLDRINGHYRLYASADKGKRWTPTKLSFSNVGGYWKRINYSLSGGTSYRLTNQKMVVDPNNPLVCYVGVPYDTKITGTYAGSNAGVMRTHDGGATWEQVPDVPAATMPPGFAGMCMDRSSGTTTLDGRTVTRRIILPCSGQGIYISTDGGKSFSRATSDPTPPTKIQYTTIQSNSIIVVQIICCGLGTVKSINDSAGLNWQHRGGPAPNTYSQFNAFEYWALAPKPGKYDISVSYHDGNIAYIPGPVAATASSCTISGTTLVLGGEISGEFTIGQEISGAGIPAGSPQAGYSSGIYIIEGAGNTWTINTPLNLKRIAVTAKPRVSNQVGVFAVSGADPAAPFESGGPVLNVHSYSPAPSITTRGAAALVFSVGYSDEATADAGYSILSNNRSYSFWSEISDRALGPGTHTPGKTLKHRGTFITDAIAQAPLQIIALDGTPQYANSGPSANMRPVNITTAQVDAVGTFWAIDGPQEKAVGGIWRNLSGSATWDRMDGAKVNRFGTPYARSLGNCICVDPRPGHEGRVTIIGPHGVFRGWQTYNGNASFKDVTWVGAGGSARVSHVRSPVVAWLGWLNVTNQGPSGVGDMVIDPTDGTYVFAHGKGVYRVDADLNLSNSPDFRFNATNFCQGTEETLVQDILSAPGSPYPPIIGMEDQMVVLSNIPKYPTQITWKFGNRGHCWQLDYASDNPAFIWAYVVGENVERLSGFSIDYGANGSWSSPVNVPPATNSGGCIACASAGVDGLSSKNKTACVVIIPSRYNTRPIYTTDNGTNWQNCTFSDGLSMPRTFIHTRELCTRLIAADRVRIGTYYMYVPGVGVYYSTDFGATFNPSNARNPFILSRTVPLAGYSLMPVPGHAGHLWLVASIYAQGALNLNYSTDGTGHTWRSVAGISNCRYAALGKAQDGGYPTIFIYGTVNDKTQRNVSGFFRGVCNGSGPDAGFTWTKFGDMRSIPPTSVIAGGISQIWGDWNVFGRMYMAWSQAGVIMYNL